MSKTAIYQPQRIKGIRVKNFMRIEEADVQIDESEHLIMVFGPNSSGKTSLARAIIASITGAKGCPDKPVHNGADKAEVELELTDHTVSWAHNGDKASLNVTNGPKGAPQTTLNALLGSREPIAFYPFKFLDAPKKEQADAVRMITGCNTSDIETRRFKAEEARKPVNQEVSRLKGLVKSLQTFSDAPAEPKSLNEIRTRQKAEQAKQRAIDDATKQLSLLNAESNRLGAEIDRMKVALAKAEEAREVNGNAMGDAEIQRAALPIPDLESIEAELDSVEEINAKVAANQVAAKARDDLMKTEVEADRLTALMKQCDAEKAAALAAVTMPVEGLGFDGDTLTLNGQPLDQAGMREQLTVAASVGALHGSPRLRFGIIDQGAEFDRDGLKMLDEIGEALDMQWIINIVSDLDKNGDVETNGRSGIVVNAGHASSVCKEQLF